MINEKVYVIGEIIEENSGECGKASLEYRVDGSICENGVKFERLVPWYKENDTDIWTKLEIEELYKKGEILGNC